MEFDLDLQCYVHSLARRSGFPPMQLQGQTVLIIEDEPLIGDYLICLVEEAGATAVGPAVTNRQAMEILANTHVTAAILDVNLRDGESVPTGTDLVSRGIPFIVSSGASLPQRLRSMFGTAPVLTKPAPAGDIIASLARVIADNTQASRRRSLLGHVLVIEDHADTAVILEGHLRAFGCDSVGQSDTEQGAILMAQARRPDLMVVDLRLREGNGLAAALTIQKSFGTPMIVVTASPTDVKFLDPALVVEKPFTAAGLKTAIACAMSTTA